MAKPRSAIHTSKPSKAQSKPKSKPKSKALSKPKAKTKSTLPKKSQKSKKSKKKARSQPKPKQKTNQKSIKQSHWRDITVMKPSERAQMPEHCLLDPKGLKYPICPKNSNKISCQGLNAAKKRATMQRNATIKKKAILLEKELGCSN